MTSCCSSQTMQATAKIESIGPTIGRTSRTIKHDISQKVDTSYEFESGAKGILASSFSGSVYKAKHRHNKTYHAVKQLDKKSFRGNSWQKDINALLMLDHPHICRIFEVWEDDKNVYLVMELCAGGDLTTYGNSKQAKDTNEARVSLLIRQMVGAVTYFHNAGQSDDSSSLSHVHGDICLENWLFAKPVINTNSPLDLNLKMIDFGLAQKHATKKRRASPRETPDMKDVPNQRRRPSLAGLIRGASCQAPEQLNAGKITQKTDVWALGVITYFLLSGQAPFKHEPGKRHEEKVKLGQFDFEPQELWKPITQDAKDFIKACLKRDLQERPKSIELQGLEWMINAKRVFEKEVAKAANGAPVPTAFRRPSRQGQEMMMKRKASISDGPLPCAERLVTSFKKMNKLTTFEKAVFTTAAHRLPTCSILHLQREFQKLDKNNDGVLSAQEIYDEVKKTGIDADELMAVLRDADMDGSGTIEYTEFIAAAYDFHRHLQDSLIRSVFESFDIDHDGSVTKKELLQMLNGQKIGEEKSIYSTRDLEDVFGKEIFEDALSELDNDGDRTIDFKEFRKLLKVKH